MKVNNRVNKLTYSAMFLAIAFVLPFLTGQIPQIGAMLCPMHLPVLICGYICGGGWGLLVGFIAPVLRSVILGMPPMFPTAICMAFELATYGWMAGVLYRKLALKHGNVYISLLAAMIAGRIVWGVVMFACLGFDTGKFGLAAFLAGAVTNAIPGIILQLVAVPILVMALKRNR